MFAAIQMAMMVMILMKLFSRTETRRLGLVCCRGRNMRATRLVSVRRISRFPGYLGFYDSSVPLATGLRMWGKWEVGNGIGGLWMMMLDTYYG